MKKIIVSLCLSLMLAVPSPCQTVAQYLRVACAKLVLATALSTNYDYDENMCLIGKLIKQGDTYGIYYSFSTGYDYKIIAVGDEDIQDIDLYVEDDAGNILAQDRESSAIAIVDFRPAYSGRKVLRMKNYRSKAIGFCMLAVMKKTYSSSPNTNELIEALKNAIDIADEALKQKLCTNFISSSACIFGGNYSSGDADGFYNITVTTSGRYAFLCAGSDNVSDVDAWIYKQYSDASSDGTEIAKDADTKKAAVISSYLDPDEFYYFKYKNYKSNGRGCIVGLILTQ